MVVGRGDLLIEAGVVHLLQTKAAQSWQALADLGGPTVGRFELLRDLGVPVMLFERDDAHSINGHARHHTALSRTCECQSWVGTKIDPPAGRGSDSRSGPSSRRAASDSARRRGLGRTPRWTE